MKNKYENLKIGDKFNSWEITREPHKVIIGNRIRVYIVVKCVCGYERSVEPYEIINGQSKICKTCSAQARGTKPFNGLRKCSRCKEFKELINFTSDKSNRCGLASKCRECCKLNKIKRKYNLLPEDFIALIETSLNKCYICKSELTGTSGQYKTCIDHCHKNGQVRGILCNNCNMGLGAFKDNIEFMKSAIEYLETDNLLNNEEIINANIKEAFNGCFRA